MSRSYKFHNPNGVYFVSFAVVDWLDVFTRKGYKEILIDSLIFCQRNKGLKVYAWCIMTNHVHLVIQASGFSLPSDIMRDFKKFTSQKILKAIMNSAQESRKKIFLERFKLSGIANGNNSKYQFWRQDNKPIELWSNAVIDQKIEYIHNNPVEAGIVDKSEDYIYSSARDYSGTKGMIELEIL